MKDLATQHCVPCEGTEEPFDATKVKIYLPALSLPWDVVEGKKIRHSFLFKNFPAAIAFVNAIVPIAEREGHHPDLHIYYNTVTVELWTHAIGGLSQNDFIMAVKIESLV